MGSDCSTEREIVLDNKQIDSKLNSQNANNNNILNDNILPNFVEIKNYKEYNYRMETLKRKIMDKLDKFKKSRKIVDLNLINE